MTTDNTQAQIIFDLPLINKTGDIGAVLVDLMDTQMRKIRNELQQEFPKGEVSPKALQKIMNSFVSLEGTKQPRRSDELTFPDIPENQVVAILQKLVDGRLLRVNEDEVYELVHDTLAAHLNENRDQDDIAIDETVKMVKDAVYFQDKTNRFLSGMELGQFEKYATIIKSTNRLTDEEWAFVEKSRRKELRRKWLRIGTFAAVLGVAVLMTVLYVKNRALIEANGLTLAELEANKERIEKNNELTEKTAKALQDSKNDRTDAFKRLLDVKKGMEEDSIGSNDLVDQLTNNFLSEFTLFPFYNLSRSLEEPVAKVIVEDNLEFIIAPAKDSPIAFFKDSLLDNTQETGFRLFSSTYNQDGQLRDMLLHPDGETVFTAHSNGKILRWKVGVDHPLDTIYVFKPIKDTTTDDPEINIRAMSISGDRLLVGIDSLVYEVGLQETKYPRFIIGFNRPIKFLMANPKKPGQFAVVKENSSQIFLCHNDVDTISTIYQAGLSTVTSLAFSPDGRKLMAAYEEGEVAKLWDLRRPQIITDFKGHRALISSIAFSKDGRKVITGSWDQTAILWTAKGEIIKRLIGHKRRIRSVAYTDNNFALTCSDEGNIKLWRLAPLAKRERIFTDSIRAMATSPEHNTVAFSFYYDVGRFYLWDWEKDQLDTIWQPLSGSDQKGDIVALAYAEDGRHILAASENTLTTLIDLSEAQEHLEFRGGGKVPITSSISAIDINNDYVLIADRRNHQVVLRDRKDPSKFITLRHRHAVHAAKFSPDGKSVLAGCEDGKAYLWDITANPPTKSSLGRAYL